MGSFPDSYLVNWDSKFDPSQYIYVLLALAMPGKILGKGAVEVKLLDQNNQSRVIRLINTF